MIHISHGAIKANHCSFGQAEVCSQVLHQKALGFAAPRKDHQPVFGVFATPTPITSDQMQQPLIFGKISRPNHRQQGLQLLKGCTVGWCWCGIGLQALEPVAHRFQCRHRAGKQAFGQGGFEQLACLGFGVAVRQLEILQQCKYPFFPFTGLALDISCITLLHAAAQISDHILSEAPYIQILDVVFGVLARIGDRRGVEHVHQAREALRLAVMGRRRQKYQCFRSGS